MTIPSCSAEEKLLSFALKLVSKTKNKSMVNALKRIVAVVSATGPKFYIQIRN